MVLRRPTRSEGLEKLEILLGIHPEFTAFSRWSKELVICPGLCPPPPPSLQAVTSWLLLGCEEAGPKGDTSCDARPCLGLAGIPGCCLWHPSCRHRAEPLVQALLAPHHRAAGPTAERQAAVTSLKDRREERGNGKGWEKERVWGERERRGMKGRRKDVSQLLGHFGKEENHCVWEALHLLNPF